MLVQIYFKVDKKVLHNFYLILFLIITSIFFIFINFIDIFFVTLYDVNISFLGNLVIALSLGFRVFIEGILILFGFIFVFRVGFLGIVILGFILFMLGYLLKYEDLIFAFLALRLDLLSFLNFICDRILLNLLRFRRDHQEMVVSYSYCTYNLIGLYL